ncbi:4658_t:CDS:2 [Ambispora leptoticha]|uniref:4658_t:CDS:1 n=1 Tax=Ambispora leptoticha TaxID=144679 RepID=A0A9N9CC23_9GLOM|nr:4658_t:CDS:2 [Ambispora leptoticha]
MTQNPFQTPVSSSQHTSITTPTTSSTITSTPETAADDRLETNIDNNSKRNLAENEQIHYAKDVNESLPAQTPKKGSIGSHNAATIDNIDDNKSLISSNNIQEKNPNHESNAFSRPQSLLSRQEPQQLSHPTSNLSLTPSPSFNARSILQYTPSASSSASPSLPSLAATQMDHRKSLPHSPPPQQQQPPLSSFEEVKEGFKRVIELVKRDEMFDAFNLLSNITANVVTNCEKYGLTSDENFSNDRETFWKTLNDCWLYAISQVNKNHSKHHQQQSQEQQQQSLPQRIGKEYLYKLRESVVSWADVLERYGLVDYEMGYWEQDFLEAIDTQINLFLNDSDMFHHRPQQQHQRS